MQRLFSCQVRLMRLFRRVKQAQTDHFVVKLDLRQPFVILLTNAHKSAFTFRFASVLSVFGISSFAKIAQTVVRSITIDVVKLFCRPNPMHIQPSQSVRKIQNVVQTNSAVAVLHVGSGQRTRAAFAAGQTPRKQSRVWVVVDQLAKAVLRKFWCVHNSHNIMLIKGCQA